jgi:hypothetical protein
MATARSRVTGVGAGFSRHWIGPAEAGPHICECYLGEHDKNVRGAPLICA